MRYLVVLGLAAGALTLTGCGSGDGEKHVAPDVRGQRLDVAERHLADHGLEFDEVGGGSFGIVVRANWEVCDQEPRPGERTARVRLIVDRQCPPPTVRVVPDLSGRNLADAEHELDALGLAYDLDAGDREVVVAHLWEVCSQDPPPGAYASRVELHVEHDCDDWD